MSAVIIGCEMLENEIELARKNIGCTCDIKWVPRKYHDKPEKLRGILQETIDQCQNYDRILLTFGCCGGGVDGLYSPYAEMIFLDHEDCIHMLLCSLTERQSRVEKGVIYLTDGWTRDDQAIVQQYECMERKYGPKTCKDIMGMMYGNFHGLSVIDTGAYDLGPTLAYAERAAEVTGLEQHICSGTIEQLERMFSGDFSGRCRIYPAGQVVHQQDFCRR